MQLTLDGREVSKVGPGAASRGGLCGAPDCRRLVTARGLCRKHYNRVYRLQNLEKMRARDRVAARKWRAENPDKAFANELKHRYGLTPEEHALMVAKGCALCGTHKGRLVVDHDHRTGRVRAVLCDRCNKSLGMFGDDPGRLRAAAEYLEAHDSTAEINESEEDDRGPDQD